jgi:hypothetical protein
MTLRTLWNSIKERAYGTPAPKTPRKPRQRKPAQPELQPETIQNELRFIHRTLSGHHDRIHELEQIEHRRSEREKEMKTNGKEDGQTRRGAAVDGLPVL